MTNTSSSSSSGGIGFVGALTILFIALKLTGVIAWSWWWVLSPLWITFLVVIVVGLIIFAVVFGRQLWRDSRDYRNPAKRARGR